MTNANQVLWTAAVAVWVAAAIIAWVKWEASKREDDDRILAYIDAETTKLIDEPTHDDQDGN